MGVRYDSVLDDLRQTDVPFPVYSTLPLTAGPGSGAIWDNGLYVYYGGTWQLIMALTPPKWFGGLLLDLPVGTE